MCAVLHRKQYDVAAVGAHIAAYDEKLPACIVRAILLLQQPAARLDGTSLAFARTLGTAVKRPTCNGRTEWISRSQNGKQQFNGHGPHRSDAGLSLPGGSNLRATCWRQRAAIRSTLN